MFEIKCINSMITNTASMKIKLILLYPAIIIILCPYKNESSLFIKIMKRNSSQVYM